MEYSPHDEALIEAKWQELVEECRKHKICKREDDWQFVRRAYFLAKEAHKGVRRRSGEPYVIHPIEVALIAVREIGLGKKSVVAALLHDVVEDTPVTLDEIKENFGEEVAEIVDGVTKIGRIFFSTKASNKQPVKETAGFSMSNTAISSIKTFFTASK